MKQTTWFLVMSFLLITTTSSFAQRNVRGKDVLDKMKTELNLSDQQVSDWKALNESLTDKRRDILSDEDMSREDRMAEMQKLQAEREAGVAEILTEEQYAQYEQMKLEIKEEASARMEARKDELEQKMIEELQLSEEQVTQWQNLNEEYKGFFQEIAADEGLSREEKMAEMKTLQEQKETDLAEILSDEQMSQYEKLKAEMKENRPKRKRMRQGRG